MDKKTNEITKDLLMPTSIASIAVHNPEWAVYATIVNFFFGKILKQYSDKDVEFKDFIEKNKTYIGNELIKSDEFKDSFILIYENHLKERNNKKRKYLRNIFLGYIKADKDVKYKFELEKFTDVNKRITIDELELLKLLKEKIIDIHYLNSYEEASKLISEKNITNLKEKENWILANKRFTPLSNYLKEYLEKDKGRFLDQKEIEYYNNIINGLSSLGILVPQGVIDQGFLDCYNLSSFGEKYIEYLDN